MHEILLNFLDTRELVITVGYATLNIMYDN